MSGSMSIEIFDICQFARAPLASKTQAHKVLHVYTSSTSILTDNALNMLPAGKCVKHRTTGAQTLVAKTPRSRSMSTAHSPRLIQQTPVQQVIPARSSTPNHPDSPALLKPTLNPKLPSKRGNSSPEASLCPAFIASPSRAPVRSCPWWLELRLLRVMHRQPRRRYDSRPGTHRQTSSARSPGHRSGALAVARRSC